MHTVLYKVKNGVTFEKCNIKLQYKIIITVKSIRKIEKKINSCEIRMHDVF